MARGRKPLPTHLKIVRGTERKDRVNDREPKPDADKVSPPPHLTGEALQHFLELAPELLELGVLTNLDVDLLAEYCEVWAIHVDVKRKIDRANAEARTLAELAVWDDELPDLPKGDGRIDVFRNGTRQQSVNYQIFNRTLDQMQKLGAEFGLSPSSRTRITSSKKSDDPEGWDDV